MPDLNFFLFVQSFLASLLLNFLAKMKGCIAGDAWLDLWILGDTLSAATHHSVMYYRDLSY